MTRTTSTRSTVRLAALGGALTLALTGCQVSLEGDTPLGDGPSESASQEATEAPEETEPEETEPEETEPEETETDAEDTDADDTDSYGEGSGTSTEADEEGTDTDHSDDGVPAPGSVFDVGDTVTTHVQALEPGEELYGRATLATTVTSISMGDGSLFASAANAEEFQGFSEWYVQVEHEWLTFEGEPQANMVPTFVGYTDSGLEVRAVYNATDLSGIPGCSIDLPPTEDRGVGETASDCKVFAIPDGLTLESVGWQGDDKIDGDGVASDNPYYDDPVLWVSR